MYYIHNIFCIVCLMCSLCNTNAQVTDEQFALQQATGLNCTAYITVTYNNLTYPNQSNVSNVMNFVYKNWNCTGSIGSAPCAPGLYSLAGSASCSIQCPARYYCPGNGSAIVCPNGTYSLGGAAFVCTPCTANSYCLNGTQTACPASVLSSGGAWECKVPCPPGHMCPGNGQDILCMAGYYSLGGAVNCTQCQAGYYCPNNYERTFCPVNTWSSPGSFVSCDLPCPFGVVCPGNGKLECTVCKGTEYIVRECGVLGDTICNTTCHPGLFGAFYTGGFCRGCPVGTEMPFYGASVCSTCTSGKYANVTGLSTCTQCSTGTSTSVSSGFVNCVQVIYFVIYISHTKEHWL